jgi:hypothetical protein
MMEWNGCDICDICDIETDISTFQRCGHKECDLRLGHLGQGPIAADIFYDE